MQWDPRKAINKNPQWQEQLIPLEILAHWRYPFFNVKTQMYVEGRDRDRLVVGFTTTYAGWDAQHYVIQFVSDFRQLGSFLRVLQFPLPIKLTATIWLKYCWVALNTIKQTNICNENYIVIKLKHLQLFSSLEIFRLL